jgi:tryptophan-rich sensory protein
MPEKYTNIQTKPLKIKKKGNQYYNFFHGFFFFVLINIDTLTWGSEVKNYYESLNKPFFAPPVWFFGFIWTLIDIFVITGNIWALNWRNKLRRKSSLSPKEDEILQSLNAFLICQGIFWFFYVIFHYLSFGTRIPFMFFAASAIILGVAFISLFLAIRIDKLRSGSVEEAVNKWQSLTFTLILLTIWTCIATALGYSVWLMN